LHKFDFYLKESLMSQVMFQTDKSFLSPEEIADHLRISRRTVMRWVEQGMLSALRIGNVTRVPVDAYQQFLTAHLIVGDVTKEISRARPKRRKRTKRNKTRKATSWKKRPGAALAPLSLTPALFIPPLPQLTGQSEAIGEKGITDFSSAEIAQTLALLPSPTEHIDSTLT
jgi:excisionase family DNA binding protein